MEYAYRVSMIVPIYNQERFLTKCVDSLINQTIDPREMEILLIDDGSTDNSPKMCDEYSRQYSNIKVIHKENGGLSDARNCGIKNANGKYLMYVDSDDYLDRNTVLPVINFFDQHYEEVDLVTYPSITLKNGKPAKPHYRYSVFNHSAVYDLTDRGNIYAGVTRIEVCVKNCGDSNVMFSDDRSFRHEDQKYCTDVILNKLKVGFCESGAYYYEQQPDGLQNTYFHAYYIFESTMSFWEEEFGKYKEEVPRYLQALYVSDYSWKLRANILMPYHYDEDGLRDVSKRIDALLDRVDVDVIGNHPALDSFQKAHLFEKKKNSGVKCIAGNGSLALVAEDKILYGRKKIEVVLLKTRVEDGELRIQAFLKSPCFQFVCTPRLYAEVNVSGVTSREEVPIRRSSWSYYNSKAIVNDFWYFEFAIPCSVNASMCFFVYVNDEKLETNYYFMPRAVFSNSNPRRYEFLQGNTRIYFRNNTIGVDVLNDSEARNVRSRIEKSYLSNKKRWLIRASVLRSKKKHERIWLYHDCHGVEKNNAYYQFIHDFDIDDGVNRYYVVNDDLNLVSHLFSKRQSKNVIGFRSDKHKLLFLKSEKIITAYIEETNYMAFGKKAMPYYQDLFNAEVVYLQHGVLHAHQPWKYSLDRLLLDKEVVSTYFEANNLKNNYLFSDRNLIKSGMPRYDYIDSKSKPKRKILFAPSWRKYLISQKADGQWSPVESTFRKSLFYREVNDFLSSEKLNLLLEKYDYTLELKLHPIFSEFYSSLFELNSPRVSLASDSVNDSDYAVFITDFSSYRFDYVYLHRAIMYFFPDYKLFQSGMCDYRETDLPLAGQFGDMALDADRALAILQSILENDGQPKPEYMDQMSGFFYFDDEMQCDRIYQSLSSGPDEPLLFCDNEFPDAHYIFEWGTLLERAGGMTRAMLRRACTLSEKGVRVDILLGGRGKSQLDSVGYWKSVGYNGLDNINLICIEDYLADRFCDPETTLPVDVDNSDYEFYYYKKKVRFARGKNVVVAADCKKRYEYFYGSNGHIYMTVTFKDTGSGFKESAVTLHDQRSGQDISLRNASEMREYFFSNYVNDQKSKVVFVFDDPFLDMEPGFKYMDESEKTVVKIAVNHGIGIAPPREWYSVLNPRIKNNLLPQPSCVDGFILLTQVAKKDFVKRLGNRTSFYVIPNVIDKPSGRVDALSRDLKKAVYVGRFAKEKQPDHIIKAFEIALNLCPDITLDMYGSGELQENMQRLIDEKGLGKSVKILGFTNDPAGVFESAAVSLCTSEFECNSLSIGESLINGCPVISYDCKNSPGDYICQGTNGFLVPPNDVNALGLAIADYFNRVEDIISSASCAAYDSMVRFDEEHYLSSWAACLNTILFRKQFKGSLSRASLSKTIYRSGTLTTVLSLLGHVPVAAFGHEAIYARKYNADHTDYCVVDCVWSRRLSKQISFDVKLLVTAEKDQDVSICVEWDDFFYEIPVSLR